MATTIAKNDMLKLTLFNFNSCKLNACINAKAMLIEFWGTHLSDNSHWFHSLISTIFWKADGCCESRFQSAFDWLLRTFLFRRLSWKRTKKQNAVRDHNRLLLRQKGIEHVVFSSQLCGSIGRRAFQINKNEQQSFILCNTRCISKTRS